MTDEERQLLERFARNSDYTSGLISAFLWGISCGAIALGGLFLLAKCS